MELSGDDKGLTTGVSPREEVVSGLMSELEMSKEEAELYLDMLSAGWVSPGRDQETVKLLMDRGMAILSGDGTKIIPVHPRLGIANHYRTWREGVVKEMNEKRMRVDKLIVKLTPVYEAAMEKRTAKGGR